MSEVLQRSGEELEDIARKLGLIVVYPFGNELILDWDDTSNPMDTGSIEGVLSDNAIAILGKLILTSPNGKGLHCYIKLNIHLSLESRIALQAAMQSDPVKEALSILRAFQGAQRDCCTVLFETKASHLKVLRWREECSNAIAP